MENNSVDWHEREPLVNAVGGGWDVNNNNQNSKFPHAPPVYVESRRWLVLFVFSVVGSLQGMIWLTQTASPNEVIEYYGWAAQDINSDEQIELLLNWGPIAYLPVVPIVMLVVAQGGSSVWYVVMAGAVFSCAGAAVRLIPTFASQEFRQSGGALYLLHLGQFLNGVAGPMVCATVSAVSAEWFPPSQRTFATSIANGASVAGPSVGFLLALFVTTPQALSYLLMGECGVAIAMSVLWFCMPRLPKYAPSQSAQQKRHEKLTIRQLVPVFRDGVAICAKNRSFVFLSLSGGLLTGAFNCWSGSLANTLGGQLGQGLSQWMGFVANTANLAANNLIGFVSERWFVGRYKRLIIILYLVQSAGYLLFCFSLPIGDMPNALIPIPATSLLGVLCVASAALGGATPLFFELGAEMTFPTHEGVSAGVITGLNNAFGLIILFVIPHIPKTYTSVLMAGIVCVCTLLVLLVRESYGRSNKDLGGDAEEPPQLSLQVCINENE